MVITQNISEGMAKVTLMKIVKLRSGETKPEDEWGEEPLDGEHLVPVGRSVDTLVGVSEDDSQASQDLEDGHQGEQKQVKCYIQSLITSNEWR